MNTVKTKVFDLSQCVSFGSSTALNLVGSSHKSLATVTTVVVAIHKS